MPIKILLFVTLILWAKVSAFNADSLAYVFIRDSVDTSLMLQEGMTELLDATDNLFKEGYYAEAFDLLQEDLSTRNAIIDTTVKFAKGLTDLEYSETSPVKPVAVPLVLSQNESKKKGHISWRIYSGASCDLVSDADSQSVFDSTVYNQDSITANYSVWDATNDNAYHGFVSARLLWTNPLSFVSSIEPTVYFSDTRLRGGISAYGTGSRQFFKYRFLVEGEKKLNEEYKDSSDGIKGEARFEVSTRPLRFPLFASCEVAPRAEKFHFERSYYTSSVGYSIKPYVGYQSPDGSFFGELAWNSMIDNHYRAFSVDDVRRNGPSFEINWYTTHLSMNTQGEYTHEYYPYQDNPAITKTFNADANMIFRVLPILELGCDGRFSHVQTTYQEQDVLYNDFSRDSMMSYTLGPDISYMLKPKIAICPFAGITSEISLTYERNNYAHIDSLNGKVLSEPLKQWESYDVYEPEVRLHVVHQTVTIDGGCRYRFENVLASQTDYSVSDTNTVYLTRMAYDQNEWNPFLSLMVDIRQWISVDASADYRYRFSRENESISKSFFATLTATVRF
jgi:hypothetical protein